MVLLAHKQAAAFFAQAADGSRAHLIFTSLSRAFSHNMFLRIGEKHVIQVSDVRQNVAVKTIAFSLAEKNSTLMQRASRGHTQLQSALAVFSARRQKAL
jgi:hypothetical protein